MKSILALLFVVLALACFAAEPNQKEKVWKHGYTLDSGTYHFTVEQLPGDPAMVGVQSTFQPVKPDGLGLVSDEAIALGKLLDELGKHRQAVYNFYIPVTFQAEVLQRVQAAAAKSAAWKNLTPETSQGILLRIIEDGKSYREFRATLVAHGLDIGSISVENINAVPMPDSGGAKVPKTWTTFIAVKKLAPTSKAGEP